jgi:uncharacterized protein (TIGR03086 family)
VSEISERYRGVARGFTTRVQGVAADDWSSPTPCPDWTVRDLVVHVTSTHNRVMATLEGTEPVQADPEADIEAQWLAATSTILEALSEESRASTLMSGMFGERTFESLVGGRVCTDTLVHTWDLARATGQDETLDSHAVTMALEALIPIDDAIRRPGGFGTKINPSPGADAQIQFLNFCGRRT